jgi:hypothetical protein
MKGSDFVSLSFYLRLVLVASFCIHRGRCSCMTGHAILIHSLTNKLI